MWCASNKQTRGWPWTILCAQGPQQEVLCKLHPGTGMVTSVNHFLFSSLLNLSYHTFCSTSGNIVITLKLNTSDWQPRADVAHGWDFFVASWVIAPACTTLKATTSHLAPWGKKRPSTLSGCWLRGRTIILEGIESTLCPCWLYSEGMYLWKKTKKD